MDGPANTPSVRILGPPGRFVSMVICMGEHTKGWGRPAIILVLYHGHDVWADLGMNLGKLFEWNDPPSLRECVFLEKNIFRVQKRRLESFG